MKQAILKQSILNRAIFLVCMITGIAVVSAAQTPSPPAFRQEGIASWYGTEFDGKPTASGEIFNAASYTAAHPSLPFGSILTVTNLHNNRRVTVKVNDRGPFVAERIIDLSLAAAEVLQMVETGTARVSIEHAATSMLGPAGNPALPMTPALANNTPQVTPQTSVPAPVAVAPPPAAPQQPPVTPSPAAPQYTPVPVQPAATPVAPQYVPAPVQPTATPQYTPIPVQPTATPTAPQYTPVPAQPAPAAVVPPPAVPQQTPVTPSAVPQYTPPPVQQPVATPAAPEYVAPVQPAPVPPPVFSVPPAEILGNVPAPGSSGSFRLQVASFRVPRNALNTFDKLKAAGLNPRYEQSGDLYRVVLPGLSADEIRPIAQILANNGFREVLIHRETN